MKSKETKKIEIKGGKNIRETIDLKKKWEVELRRGNWRKREERKKFWEKRGTVEKEIGEEKRNLGIYKN